MAQVTLDRKEIVSSLVLLSKRLADAIGWVCHQKEKIRFDVRDDLAPYPFTRPMGGGCSYVVKPDERLAAEVFLGISRKIKKDLRPKPGTRK